MGIFVVVVRARPPLPSRKRCLVIVSCVQMLLLSQAAPCAAEERIGHRAEEERLAQMERRIARNEERIVELERSCQQIDPAPPPGSADAGALIFTSTGKVELSEGGATVTHAATDFDGWQSAVCGAAPMTSGRHYAEVTWLSGDKGQELLVGVVEDGFDATKGGAARNHAAGWMYDASSFGAARAIAGKLYRDRRKSDWDGARGAEVGDVIGLLLDLERGSLSVYINGTRLGVMVSSGLEGPLRWAVDMLGQGSKARIASSTLDLSTELKGLRLSELKKRAREAGVDEDKLDDADDAEDTKQAVADLILAQP